MSRVDGPKEANLDYEYVTMKGNLEMNFGAAKKKETYGIEDGELPSVPVLTNGSKIKKHTKLTVVADNDLKKLGDKIAADSIKEKEKNRERQKEEGEIGQRSG